MRIVLSRFCTFVCEFTRFCPFSASFGSRLTRRDHSFSPKTGLEERSFCSPFKQILLVNLHLPNVLLEPCCSRARGELLTLRVWLTLGESSSGRPKKRECLCAKRISFHSHKADPVSTLCLGHFASPNVSQIHSSGQKLTFEALR